MQDGQGREGTLDGAAATWPLLEPTSQSSTGREGNPKIELKGNKKKKKKKPNNPKFPFLMPNPSLLSSLSPWRHSLQSPWRREAWREHHRGVGAAPGGISGGRETLGARCFVWRPGGREEGGFIFCLLPLGAPDFPSRSAPRRAAGGLPVKSPWSPRPSHPGAAAGGRLLLGLGRARGDGNDLPPPAKLLLMALHRGGSASPPGWVNKQSTRG